MIDNRKDKLLNSHSKIFRTYKELKKLLPYGFIKIRVSKGQKYNIKAQPIFFNLGKEKNKESNQTKNSNDLLHNKNIYLFSEENENITKMMKKLKSFYTTKKPQKIRLVKSESSIKTHPVPVSKKSKSNITSSKISIKDKTYNVNKTYNSLFLNIKTNTENKIKNDAILNRNSNNKFYKSFSTNNWLMKNNIFLPSITNRLKNNLPRYLRGSSDFLLNGYGKYSLIYLTNNNKSKYDKVILTEDNNINEKLKYTQTDSGQYILGYDTKNYNIEGKSFSKKNKKIRNFKKFLKNKENVIELKKIYKKINIKSKNNFS